MKTQIHNAFHKGILIESWKKDIKITDKQITGEEHLIYYQQNYYSIFIQLCKDKSRIYYNHSRQLDRKNQVGEFSYRGFEILKFEGLRVDLIGDKVL